ncbi:MAG: IS1182 family transposase [Bacteroidetes bacterium]|nr:IS1182 family transposase [Bacteroidota bacterium]MBU1422861.1 IS1182 family transposase [Bacteroidota bacterium]MBU2406488.1 IS1182 family transposase [Nanoarchaeota archaeon]MBU2472214.1 IS1182 family transposase [Bacteroidota bacterium]
MNFIKPEDRYQIGIFNSLDDIISRDNPVRIINLVIDSIVDNNREKLIKEKTSEVGPPSYHPAAMLKLYLYGYFNRISSSRRLETETYRNNELIWLLGNLHPDHWTISNFRKCNGNEIKFVTKKFREFLVGEGYIKLEKVGIDGSKIKANAKRDMLSLKKINQRLERMDEKIEEYLNRLSKNDISEDIIEELEDKEGEVDINQELLEKIIKLRKEVEELRNHKQLMEGLGCKYYSETDPESNLMKSRDGKVPAYNVQIVVDETNRMIVDSEVSQESNDVRQLSAMIDSLKEEVGKIPKEAYADKGYYNPDMIEEVEREQGIEVYVAIPETKKSEEKIVFTYDEEKDEYECSGGKRLKLEQRNKKKRSSYANMYRGEHCSECELKSDCTKSNKGRTIHRYHNQGLRDSYVKKILSVEAQEKMKIRKTLVEHPFGTIRCLMGKIPLLLRGVFKVSTEINLYTTVYNLKRLMNVERIDNLIKRIKAYSWRTVGQIKYEPT